MKRSDKVSISPEEEELEQKQAVLATLESELIQQELELSTLSAELHSFEVRYLRWVGPRLAELDSVEADLAEFHAKIYIQDKPIANNAKKARAQATRTTKAVGTIGEKKKENDAFTLSESIKSLFREIAMDAHPDFASDENERKRRNEFMVRVNEAYKAGDEKQLRNLLREWKSNPESISGEDPASELIRTIRKISQVKTRLSSIKSEIQALEVSDLNTLRLRVMEANKVGVNLLAEMAEELDKRISEKKIELNNLIDAYPHV